MNDNPVYDMIRRSNRNALLLGIISLLIAGVVFALSTLPFLLATTSAPKVYGYTELLGAQVGDFQPLYNIQVEGSAMQDSGYEEYTEKNGVKTSTDAYFGYLVVEGSGEDEFKVLIVRSPTTIDEKKEDYVGVLVKPTGVSREVFDDILKEDPEAGDVLLPYMMDVSNDNTGWIVGGIALACIALFGLYNVFAYFSRSANPTNHPIMNRFKVMGDPEQILDEIQRDRMMSEEKAKRAGNLVFTKNWLLMTQGNDLQGTRWADVAWLYKYSVRNRYGTTYYAYVWDRYGRLLNVTAKNENNANEILTEIYERAPWAIGGYDKEIERNYKQNREAFMQQVDQRRQQQRQA